MTILLAGMATFAFTTVLTIAGAGAAFTLIPVFPFLGAGRGLELALRRVPPVRRHVGSRGRGGDPVRLPRLAVGRGSRALGPAFPPSTVSALRHDADQWRIP